MALKIAHEGNFKKMAEQAGIGSVSGLVIFETQKDAQDYAAKTGKVGYWLDNSTGSSVSVTPTAPTMNDDLDTYLIPSKTGVDYFVGEILQTPGTKTYSDVDTDVTVTAKPQSGYTLTGVTSWVLDFTKKVVAGIPVGDYDDVVLSDSPSFYYPFDDSVGSTTARNLGTVKTSRLNDTVLVPELTNILFGAGGIGDGPTSASFPADDSKFKQGGIWLYAGETAFTISALIEPQIINSLVQLMTFGTIRVFLQNGKLGVYKNNQPILTAPSTSPTIGVGVRAHVAVTIDGTTVRLYVNGSEVANIASTTVLTDAQAWADATIAASGNHEYRGKVSSYAVWINKALSASRIKAQSSAAGL